MLTHPQPHIAMFSTAGKGHLIPIIELARKLRRLHGFTITVAVADAGSQSLKNLFPTDPGIIPVFLPPVCAPHDFPENALIETRVVITVLRFIPGLLQLLRELHQSARLSAYVADLFGAFTLPAVKELGIPAYLFYSSGAKALSCAFLYFPPELEPEPEPLDLSGRALDTGLDGEAQNFQVIVAMCRKFRLAEGILVNSFPDMEPDAFRFFAEPGGSGPVPPVYPVGPLVRAGSGNGGDDDRECLEWLDKQDDGSVVYVAFGSGGTLSTVQLKELARGLEMSGRRFILVAGKPNDRLRHAQYFTGGGERDAPEPVEYFPAGFIARTAGNGFVLRRWAPQIEILRHPAVGGFLTHCGWNSTLESIVHGVPLIAWPLFGEQEMNADLLCRELKVALRFRVREDEDDDGAVDGEEIARVVRELMEGEEGAEVRRRTKDLREAARGALGEDGSAIKALVTAAEKWKPMEKIGTM
ncbi:UDP-glycosyltransferase 72B1-like [Andrographis paniculata]|uniref:UDP-glycosyltransferase 72B1-like n=1 Tax=Andrographis paniculata TaxID=175694 RepID=UPI0021E940C4|nr:UDP-glycosyltransferase 72B1-like [Andrographis paniculata]